jgi:hypothetical protein
MRNPTLLLFSGVLALAALPARAQTGYPMILSAFPVGLQRGKSTEVTVSGAQNLAGTYGALFETKGVTAEIVPPAMPVEAGKAVNEVKLKVTVAADAPLGVQEFRVATPRGVSSIGMLVVDTEPQFQEKEGNNTPAEANPVELPVGINGRFQAAEDVDCYKFTANAGDQVVFSCLSARLQDKIHDLTPGGGGAHSDPILVLTDEGGRELATADDYYGPDPLLAYRFEKTGAYVLQIRDVRYMGMNPWTYRITCTKQPFLLGVYPMGGQRGKSVDVEPVGFNLGAMKTGKVDVPMMEPGEMAVQLKVGDEMTNAVPFVVNDLPQMLESGDNNTFDKANPAEVPGGFNGRIEAPNDVDHFRFKGVKGQAYTFEVFSRRYNSSLDSVVQVLDAKGAVLANNDDAEGKDSRLDWTCPADGDYVFQITDLHSRGGSDYFYTVAATLAKADFSVRCDDDKALVEPGGGYAVYAIATRRNGFTGDIKLSVEGLPPGVTATADRIPANMTQACVVFSAAPDAKPAFSRIRMWATGEVKLPDGKTETLRRAVVPVEEIYFPGGGRGVYPVDTHVVSVTEPSDVLLKLNTNKMLLKPGGTAEIEVEAVRQNGYKGVVTLDVYLRHLGGKFGDPLPPGVSLDENASKTLLSPTESKGKIILKAAADAPEIENLPIAVLGQISINFVVKVSHASEPVMLSVKK